MCVWCTVYRNWGTHTAYYDEGGPVTRFSAKRPSQGYTHSSAIGLHNFSHNQPGATAQRAHTRRHGEVLTTVTGAHNQTKVVAAGGTHNKVRDCCDCFDYALLLPAVRRCYLLLAVSLALPLCLSLSHYVSVCVCVCLSPVLFVCLLHLFRSVRCLCSDWELWLVEQGRSLNISKSCHGAWEQKNIW